MIVARRVCILFRLVSIKKNDEATAWFWFASWPVIRETFETIFVKRMIVVRGGVFYFIGDHHHCELEEGKGNNR